MFSLGLVSAADICAETVIKEHQVSITQVRSKGRNRQQVYREVVMLGENFDFKYLRPANGISRYTEAVCTSAAK
ncbi:hypothetical protein J2780_003535 [Chryseobacterium camelliae]|nr:hypothetical protein [Chryseobacterium camelliae]